ncbi:MAG: hypothetical protein STSR0008_11180 [Ignavibacterium sp.]
MLKIFLLSIILIISNSIIKPQNKININIGYGYYLSNSENSTQIMGDKNFESFVLYNINYSRENFLGFNIIFDYSYQEITKKDVIEFQIYDPSPVPHPPSIFGDIKLINHNIDIDYFAKINKIFSLGIGPSFVITNRILEVDTLLYDKLASSGLGVNCYMEVFVPFSKSEDYFFFTSKLKFRYTHSIWFDEGIRNLDDYKQEYFTVQILAGIGYSF